MSEQDAGIRWLESTAASMAEREDEDAQKPSLTPPQVRFDKHPEV